MHSGRWVACGDQDYASAKQRSQKLQVALACCCALAPVAWGPRLCFPWGRGLHLLWGARWLFGSAYYAILCLALPHACYWGRAPCGWRPPQAWTLAGGPCAAPRHVLSNITGACAGPRPYAHPARASAGSGRALPHAAAARAGEPALGVRGLAHGRPGGHGAGGRARAAVAGGLAARAPLPPGPRRSRRQPAGARRKPSLGSPSPGRLAARAPPPPGPR